MENFNEIASAENFELTNAQLRNGTGISDLPALAITTDEELEESKEEWRANPPQVQYTNLIDPEVVSSDSS